MAAGKKYCVISWPGLEVQETQQFQREKSLEERGNKTIKQRKVPNKI